jgi:hypothetical protein
MLDRPGQLPQPNIGDLHRYPFLSFSALAPPNPVLDAKR